MSTKPIYVATHPRACSTAFERVFMTQRATIQCVHEPFGDAWYYGPERLASRFMDDPQGRIDSGFSKSTYRTVLDRLEHEGSEGKRVFIKDIDSYLLPQEGKPASIAPSLRRLKRGVGTESTSHSPANGVNGVNGTHANGHSTSPNGAAPNGTNGEVNGTPSDETAIRENRDRVPTNPPLPFCTPAEPGNPTVMPREIQAQFHWAFLSGTRIIVSRRTTGFYNFDPLEAGYNELRRHFDYLRQEGLVGPRVCTRPDLSPAPGSKEDQATINEVCVVDADDMLDSPAATIEQFCRSVGLPYSPAMLEWDTEEDYAFACENFEKWRGFHNDAIESKGLVARTHQREPKSEEQFDIEWREKYGPKGAALIRQTVDACMADYLHLKQFAIRV
ncbi:hypothetical protein N7470_003825 [Penicillium chermesinum]|nr:hypothetical protein N7470_003825 [Penicillium chermesinum]